MREPETLKNARKEVFYLTGRLYSLREQKRQIEAFEKELEETYKNFRNEFKKCYGVYPDDGIDFEQLEIDFERIEANGR